MRRGFKRPNTKKRANESNELNQSIKTNEAILDNENKQIKPSTKKNRINKYNKKNNKKVMSDDSITDRSIHPNENFENIEEYSNRINSNVRNINSFENKELDLRPDIYENGNITENKIEQWYNYKHNIEGNMDTEKNNNISEPKYMEGINTEENVDQSDSEVKSNNNYSTKGFEKNFNDYFNQRFEEVHTQRNRCNECYKLRTLTNQKKNNAIRLQEQAQRMEYDAQKLLHEAYVLECKAHECCTTCNHQRYYNQNQYNYNTNQNR